MQNHAGQVTNCTNTGLVALEDFEAVPPQNIIMRSPIFWLYSICYSSNQEMGCRDFLGNKVQK